MTLFGLPSPQVYPSPPTMRTTPSAGGARIPSARACRGPPGKTERRDTTPSRTTWGGVLGDGAFLCAPHTMNLNPEFFDVPLHFRRSPRSHRNHRIGFANSSAPRNPTRFFPRLSPRTPYLLSLQLDLWSHLTSRGWMTSEDHKRHQRVHPGVCYAPNGRRSLEGTRVRLVELRFRPTQSSCPSKPRGALSWSRQKNLGRLHGSRDCRVDPEVVEGSGGWGESQGG